MGANAIKIHQERPPYNFLICRVNTYRIEATALFREGKSAPTASGTAAVAETPRKDEQVPLRTTGGRVISSTLRAYTASSSSDVCRDPTSDTKAARCRYIPDLKVKPTSVVQRYGIRVKLIRNRECKIRPEYDYSQRFMVGRNRADMFPPDLDPNDPKPRMSWQQQLRRWSLEKASKDKERQRQQKKAYSSAIAELQVAAVSPDVAEAKLRWRQIEKALALAYGPDHQVIKDFRKRFTDAWVKCHAFGACPRAGRKQVKTLRPGSIYVGRARYDKAVEKEVAEADRLVAALKDPHMTMTLPEALKMKAQAAQALFRAGTIRFEQQGRAEEALALWQRLADITGPKAEQSEPKRTGFKVNSLSAWRAQLVSAHASVLKVQIRAMLKSALAHLELGHLDEAKTLVEAAEASRRSFGSLWAGQFRLYHQAKDPVLIEEIAQAHRIIAPCQSSPPDDGELQTTKQLEKFAYRLVQQLSCQQNPPSIKDVGRLVTAYEQRVAENGGRIVASNADQLVPAIVMWSALNDPAKQRFGQLALRTVLAQQGATLLSTQVDRRPANIRQSYSRLAEISLGSLLAKSASDYSSRDLVRWSRMIDAEERAARVVWSSVPNGERWAAELRKALKPGSAAVSYVQFRTIGDGRSGSLLGPAHYAAIVVRRQGRTEVIDLGPAPDINSEVVCLIAVATGNLPSRGVGLAPDEFQDEPNSNSLRSPRTIGRVSGPESSCSAATPPTSRLYDLLYAPVRSHLAGARHIYVATDGFISQVPFVALEHEGKTLLDQKLRFQHQISLREVASTPPSLKAEIGLRLVASPDYGIAPGGSSVFSLERLEWAVEEGRQIAALWSLKRPETAVETFIDGPAAKSTVIDARATILHIATHGWVLASTSKQTQIRPMTGYERPIIPPLTQVGLAVQGVNDRGAAGKLTALEISVGNFRSTQIVVLSACNTSDGLRQGAEGVFGLHRAFLMGGAETVVSTLWSVNDETTQKFMLKYHTMLLEGEDRVEALHLAMEELRDAGYTEYRYWAPFVTYGRSGTLKL